MKSSLFAITTCCAMFVSSVFAADTDILITDIQIASPDREKIYGPVSVRLRDGKIHEIGTALEPADGERVIEGEGRFLAPGLIDSHVHLGEPVGMTMEYRASDEIVDAAIAQMPRSFLYYGYTTLVDLMGSPALAADWNAMATAPEIVFCGLAPVWGGYPTNYVPEPVRARVFPDFLIDPQTTEPDTLPEGTDAAAHTPQAVADSIAASGAACIKTTWETGFGGASDLPVPSSSLTKKLVEAAHGHGLKVVLHGNKMKAHRFAAETGVDLLAHGMWHWPEGAVLEPGSDVSATIEELVEAGTALQPTIQVLYGESDLLGEGFLDDPALATVYSPALLDWYASEDGQWFRREMLTIYTGGLEPVDDPDALIAPAIERVASASLAFGKRGGTILFGSDTPSGPTYANPPGLNGYREMQELARAGFSPAMIFRAATLDNASFLGRGDRLGRVAEGYEADLLILRADPFASVEAFDTIETVILDGAVIERADLSAATQ